MARQKQDLDVCLSFAGEDKDYVEKVNRPLNAMGVRTFCYTVEGAEWGEDLKEFLADVYQNRAKYCVVFFSRHYVGKPWPALELSHAAKRERKENRAYILPVRLDDTELPEAHKTRVYLDVRTLKEPEEVAYRIVRKLFDLWRLNDRINPRLIAAAAVVLVVLLAALLYDKIPSDTSIAMGRTDATMLRLHATNRGWRESEITGATLRFGGLPIDAAPLSIVEGGGVVPGRKSTSIGLSVPAKELRRPCVNGRRLTRAGVDEALLEGKNVALDVRVKERGVTKEKTRTWSRSLPASDIQEFIRHWIPDRSPPCDEDPI